MKGKDVCYWVCAVILFLYFLVPFVLALILALMGG